VNRTIIVPIDQKLKPGADGLPEQFIKPTASMRS
jgi:hypothetical protein